MTRKSPIDVLNVADISKNLARNTKNSVIVHKLSVINMNTETFLEPNQKLTPDKFTRRESFAPVHCKDKLITVDKNTGKIVRFEIYKQNCRYNITLIVNSPVKFENFASFARFTYFVTKPDMNITLDEYYRNAIHIFSMPHFANDIKPIDIQEHKNKFWSYTIIFQRNKNHLNIIDVRQNVKIHLMESYCLRVENRL